MMPAELQPSADLNEEVSTLIEVLYQTVKVVAEGVETLAEPQAPTRVAGLVLGCLLYLLLFQRRGDGT